MNNHNWKYLYCHPHNGEYIFECIHCKCTDYMSRSDFLAGLKPNPINNLCSGKIEEIKEKTPQVPKSENPWKGAVLNAMKSYNMDIAHYENKPDNAVYDLLCIHANAIMIRRAMIDYFSKEGDNKE